MGAEHCTSTFVIGDHTVLVADPDVLRLYELIDRLAHTQLSLLVLGESGVGKENVAQAVHAWSPRASAPLVAVDCAALHGALIEGELFGYERGAFAGAVTSKPGLLERADGGTLFLDEVNELSGTAQAKLLRVLETQRMTRLGGMHERALDIRVVAATSCDLTGEIAAGRFREDLYFRLNGATLVLPPLRARRREIPILAQYFLAATRTRTRSAPATISSAAMQRLAAHPWPGNIRELKHAMEYAAALVDGDRVELWHLPVALVPEAMAAAMRPAMPAASPPAMPAATPAATPAAMPAARARRSAARPAAPARAGAASARGTASFRPIAEELRALERRRMAEALCATGGVKCRAAELIGMPVRTFTWKLTQYGLRDRAGNQA